MSRITQSQFYIGYLLQVLFNLRNNLQPSHILEFGQQFFLNTGAGLEFLQHLFLCVRIVILIDMYY